MKARRAIALYAPMATFLILLPSARADVVMKLEAATFGSYANIYISPYTLDVNGTDMLLNCDDFAHDVQVGDTWNAKVFQGTVDNLLNTQMGQAALNEGIISDQTGANALYDAKAWIEIHRLNLATDNYSRAVASYAIWDLFEPQMVDDYMSHHTPGSFQNDVHNTILKAKANGAGLHQYLTIYSPSGPITSGPDANPNNFAQEYDRYVPDGGTTVMFLGGALLGLATLRRKWRL